MEKKMNTSTKQFVWILLVVLVFLVSACENSASTDTDLPEDSEIYNGTVPVLVYTLPSPETDSDMSLEKALAERRSRREFQDTAISKEQLSQILWAAYGYSAPGLRTAPSAGALYPLEIYVVLGKADGIESGVYRYNPEEHCIEKVVDGDIRDNLSEAALSQSAIAEAPVSLLYSAIFSRTTVRYDERGVNYVYMELGHSAQNVYLQVEALGLGTCAIGAFNNDEVTRLLNLPENEEPLYIMPIGKGTS